MNKRLIFNTEQIFTADSKQQIIDPKPIFDTEQQIKKTVIQEQPEFSPCDICVSSLRRKLFYLKTKFCMKSYKEIKHFTLAHVKDIYTGLKIQKNNKTEFNIEHTVPAAIFKGRSASDISYSKLYVNREPFADPHILFPTLKTINSLRENYVYGELANTREDALRDQSVTTIANKNIIYDKRVEYRQAHEVVRAASPQLKQMNGQEQAQVKKIIEGQEQEDIYIKGKPHCLIGECVFQPSKKFSGDISRIVFYFYLMYGYDALKRPYTNDTPWLHDDNCNFFDYGAWNIFFKKHINEYYNWSKHATSPEEIEKNKTIVDNYAVPNIFIGFYDEYGKYKSFDLIIDELLFGKKHDHEKYTNINFWNPDTQAQDSILQKEVTCPIK